MLDTTKIIIIKIKELRKRQNAAPVLGLRYRLGGAGADMRSVEETSPGCWAGMVAATVNCCHCISRSRALQNISVQHAHCAVFPGQISKLSLWQQKVERRNPCGYRAVLLA